MDGLISTAREFFRDKQAVRAAQAVDQRRNTLLKDVRQAFFEFRDEHATIRQLAEALDGPLWEETKAAANLWGFENEDERRFPLRLAEAAERDPELDLGAVFCSYLKDTPRSDEDRIQQLLGFGELVASLDARGGGERLGVGPAANFLTFAWHCLSGGIDPVFLYSSNRAIRIAAAQGALGDVPPPGRDLEDRFRTFYRVVRGLERALSEAPPGMKPGWAVEHVLDYVLTTADAGGGVASGGPKIERPGASGMGQVTIDRPLRADGENDGGSVGFNDDPSDEELQALIELDPTTLTPATAQRRDRFMDISKKRVVHADSSRMFEQSGLDLADVLPPDRNTDEPYFKVASPRAREIEREDDLRQGKKRKADTRRVLNEVRKVKEDTRHATRSAEPAPAPAPPAPPPARTKKKGRVIVSRDWNEPEPQMPVEALVTEFRGEVVQAKAAPPRAPSPRGPSPGAGHLSRDLHLSPELCDDMVAAAKGRGQVLLLGPPASGKTYVARRLAIYLAGHEDRVLNLRLHPELSYADLMDGAQGPGLVRELCQRAHGDRDRTYVLILDELDRGDPARALGEFVGGLSERGQRIHLGRSRKQFDVPRNLVVIATARELPPDPALQGRFPVVPQPADSLVLGRFLADCRPGMSWVADLHQSLNQRLGKQGHSLRVGHGLFMLPDLDVADVQGIWRREVLPLLQGYGVDTGGFAYEALHG